MIDLLQQRKLTVILCGILTISFLAVSLISYFASKNAIHLALVEKELPLTSNAIYAELQKDLVRPFFISSMMASNTFLYDWVAEGEHQPELISRYLKETKETYQVFSSFFVSDKTHRYYYPEGILKTVSPTDKADKWFFRVHHLKEPYEINIDYDQAHDNTLSIFMNFKVFNQQQEYLGATGVGLSMTRLTQLLSQYEQQYQKNIYLVDNTGYIRLTGNNRLHDNRSIFNIVGLKQVAKAALVGKQKDFQYSTSNGHYLLHVQYMPEVRLFLFVETEEDKAIAELRHALYINFIVFLLVVLATIILTNMMVNVYQNKLAVIATIDYLTQLMNRQAFETLSLNILADSRRLQSPLVMMMLDIDHFKKINDRYGHAAGDMVLQGVAHTLKHALRETDIVCRWGGEEFVICLNKCTLADAQRIAEQIRVTVASSIYQYEQHSLSVTMSIGLARFSHSETLAELLAVADSALYRAKGNGRNIVIAHHD